MSTSTARSRAASPPGNERGGPPLRRIGRFAVGHRRVVLIVSGLLLLITGAFGAGAQKVLSLSRFEAPGSPSDHAATVLHQEFHQGSPNFILLVTAKQGSVDDAAVAAAGRQIAGRLAAAPGVKATGSYWSHGSSPALASRDHRQALVLAWLDGSATTVRSELADISPHFVTDTSLIKVQAGGQDEVFRQVGEESRSDFLRAEAVIIPAVLILLLVLYRRWAAAALTLGVGLFSVLATLSVLRALTAAVPVSTFAANLALVLGLGLGIDYSLFMISRYREEARRAAAAGLSPHEAVVRTVETAGRTVLFSGATVAASLSALFALPFPFLQSFAYAGITVVATAGAAAVVLLPAALAAAGHRVLRPGAPASDENGLWHRTALRVMRRPLAYGLPMLVLLLALGAPFLGVRFGLPDERVLPADASSRVTQQQIRDGFPARETDALQVVAPAVADPAARGTVTADYAARLSRVPGVFQVDTANGSYQGGRQTAGPSAGSTRFLAPHGVWLTVIPRESALSGDTPALVRAVRAVPAPYQVAVGGFPAEMADFRSALLDRLPLVIGIIVAVTFVLLFLMTGSLLIPVKATIANTLSLTVMFGVLVWGFQNGHLSGLLDFTSTGRMEPSIPILMFCIAYGLSMDYEVFIMARIKEEYDRTGDNQGAVAAGIQRSAPLVTAAAAILALTFAAYATGRVVFLKELGVGMALAVLVDALLIRTVLVPAFMRLAGDANWWAPGPLRRLHARIGLTD